MFTTIEDVVEEYEQGHPISYIAEMLGIEESVVLGFLRQHRDNSRLPNSYTDDFKQMIAMRDLNDGVTRSSISKELEVNPNTIKKACNKYGQALKGKSKSEQMYLRIDGVFARDKCPSCKSKKINEVDDNTYYCKDCGDEHIFYDEYIQKINFEWVDE